MKLDEAQKKGVIILFIIISMGLWSWGIDMITKQDTTTSEAQNQQAKETIQPPIELVEYKEDIAEFSMHAVWGTYLNKSDRPLSISVWLDAYNGEDTYINSYMAYAPYLEPGKKWDFYITVPQSTRRVKLRKVETNFKD